MTGSPTGRAIVAGPDYQRLGAEVCKALFEDGEVVLLIEGEHVRLVDPVEIDYSHIENRVLYHLTQAGDDMMKSQGFMGHGLAMVAAGMAAIATTATETVRLTDVMPKKTRIRKKLKHVAASQRYSGGSIATQAHANKREIARRLRQQERDRFYQMHRAEFPGVSRPVSRRRKPV